jgi:hypothetical protein
MALSSHESHLGARADEDLGSSAATAESEAYVASLQKQLSELRKQLHEAQLSQRSAFDEQVGGTVLSTEHAVLEAQMREFDAHRALETQKLARERRVLERQAKALLMMPERKEREELQALKTELASVRNDASVKRAAGRCPSRGSAGNWVQFSQIRLSCNRRCDTSSRADRRRSRLPRRRLLRRWLLCDGGNRS